MSTTAAAPVGAQITDGIVVGLVFAHPDGFTLEECYPPEAGVVAIPDGVNVSIGMTYSGGKFGPAPKPPTIVVPVPEVISDRQFAQALADPSQALITQDEALAWVRTGTIPAALQAAVDQISDAKQKFAAEMLLSGATSFERHHPMVTVLRDAMKKTDADLDAIWTLGASL